MPPMLLSLIPSIIDTIKGYFPPAQTEQEKQAQEATYKALQDDLTVKVMNVLSDADKERTERLKADMSSDSWLSKNIRPMVLVYLLGVFTIFATTSAVYNIDTAYVEMLKEMLQMAFGFYFVSRGLEKVTDIIVKGVGK